MIVFSVLYPASEGARFDHDYYDRTHLPMAKAVFSATGMDTIKVLKGLSGGSGGAAPYVLMAHLIFKTEQDLHASLTGPRAAEVFADIPNFTDIQPVTQVSSLE
jgi:uncharacterized protein (TIGR02118 family)